MTIYLKWSKMNKIELIVESREWFDAELESFTQNNILGLFIYFPDEVEKAINILAEIDKKLELMYANEQLQVAKRSVHTWAQRIKELDK